MKCCRQTKRASLLGTRGWLLDSLHVISRGQHPERECASGPLAIQDPAGPILIGRVPKPPGSRMIQSRLPSGRCCFWDQEETSGANAPETQRFKRPKLRCVRMMALSVKTTSGVGLSLLVLNKLLPRAVHPSLGGSAAVANVPANVLANVVLSHQRQH